MHKIAELSKKMEKLLNEVEQYFTEKGFDIEELRDGSGLGLEELEYGNDITDKFCEHIANDLYNRHI